MTNYIFHKFDFILECKTKEKGVVVTLQRDKYSNIYSFYLINGKLGMFSQNKWVGLDSVKMATSKRTKDPYDISVEALINGIHQTFIGKSNFELDKKERRLVEVVIYDMTVHEKVNWLEPGHYYLGGGKMFYYGSEYSETTTKEYYVPELTMNVRKDIQLISSTPRVIHHPKTKTPQIVIIPSKFKQKMLGGDNSPIILTSEVVHRKKSPIPQISETNPDQISRKR